MGKEFRGTISLDIRDSTPDWGPYAEPKAKDEVKEDPPNILYIVIDDTGFGAWDMYGGLIKMPNLMKIANAGLVYTNFHTTALCSPTRSSLLNGRNATSNGMSCIEECTTGFPGSNGRIPFENAFISTVLGERGYSTSALGKWHLAPEEESNMASTKRNWPLGRGFERFYGFLGGETDQWYPDIIHDNHISEPPYAPDMDDPVRGYHVTKDLTDKAILFIQDVKAIAPDKPWMMYFCPGSNHAPHQIWPQLIKKYGYNELALTLSGDPNDAAGMQAYLEASTFGDGYEAYRVTVLAKMVELGIFDDSVTTPSPINPHNEGTLDENNVAVDEGPIVGVPDGKSWPQTDYVREWDTLELWEKVLFCRMAEIYAAFSSYTDEQIGRLLTFLEETGQFDNTIIMACADNGASAEGGPNGSFNECLFMNDIPDDPARNFAHILDLGTERSYGHYPSGWAWGFDTPFKYWKRWSGYEGGAAAPFMMCGPGIVNSRGGDTDPPEYRKQYIHAVDVVPTIYEMLTLDAPDVVRGYTQNPIEGISFAYTFGSDFADDSKRYAYNIPKEDLPTDANGEPVRVRESQFYSMLGTRGIWHKGWLASTLHAPTPSDWSHFEDDTWELFCLDGDTSEETPATADPTQSVDLAADFPSKLSAMQAAWYTMAGRYNGVPLDDRSTGTIMTEPRPQLREDPFQQGSPEGSGPLATFDYTFLPGGSEIPEAVAPNIRTRSYAIAATVDFSPLASNVPALSAGRKGKGKGSRSVLDKQAVGVLFAQGGRFGGHTLYLLEEGDKHRLCYVYNWLGMREQRVSCVVDDLVGIMEFKVEFHKDPASTDNLANSDTEYGRSVAGTVTLTVRRGGADVGGAQERHLGASDGNGGMAWNMWNDKFEDPWVTQPAKFALCGEGMNVGKDGGQSVSHDYNPNVDEFEGGRIKQVVVTIQNNAEARNHDVEFQNALWRD